VVAAATVANEATTRTTLEASKLSAEDRATAAESVAATAMTDRDALAVRLALAEVEIEKLRAPAVSANEAAERATTTVAAAKATAQDAAQTAAWAKAALETKVVDLEHGLATAGVDLAMANRQFSQVANQLQVVSEEATRLRESNAKLSKDLEGESSRHFLSPLRFSFASYSF
jgi:predicted  nucleic acid-binding Zn-ribbon protein